MLSVKGKGDGVAVVERLDKTLEQARRVQQAVGHMGTLARVAGHAEISEVAQVAGDSIVPVIGKLMEMGAKEGSASYALEVPFHALAPKELQDLEERLKAAAPLADAVDALRGRTGGDGLGADLGEQLRELLYRVQIDLYGPGDSVTGGRE